MTGGPSQAPLRREPTQQRARDRIEAILDAADRMLSQDGPEALGTKQVAAAAKISIGSLYFWFPDKESIAEALALRYWGELADLVAGVADAAELTSPDDPVGETLSTLVSGFRARPGFLALWFGGMRTERLRDATRPLRRDVESSIVRLLATRGWRSSENLRLVAGMVVLLGDGLLREAFRADPHGDEELLREGAVVLRAYIEHRLENPDEQ